MFNPTDIYKKALLSANWLLPESVADSDAEMKSWLLETGSMTKRLKRQCDDFQVRLIEQRDTHPGEFSDKVLSELGDTPAQLREVLLEADGMPWIYGLSYLPKMTLTGGECALEMLGERPLGELVFSQALARRDALQVAEIHFEGNTLWARCSRLWFNEKPLLVYELFLPSCPLYQRTPAPAFS